MKRAASQSLRARPSPHNASVTLYEASDAHTEVPSPRRSKRIKLETGTEELNVLKNMKSELSPPPLPTPVKSKTQRSQSSPKKQKLIPQSLEIPHPAPTKWRETYDAIKEMRSRTPAPVDTMGCDQAQFKESDPRSQRYATLVSLMLSSQTKDEVTDVAVSKLREVLGGSLTVEAMIDADDDAIAQAIAKVGFWRRKTGYLKQTAIRLRDNFNSDVPKTVDELCSLPGVGPKMAFLTLQVAWNLNHGIGVDIHVHRITNRLGWHKPPTKTPEETRLNLQSWLPSELHKDINHMLVGFGQTICVAINPRCGMCTLSTKNLCPVAAKMKKSNSTTIIPKSESGLPKIEVAIEAEESKLLVTRASKLDS